MSRIRSAVAKTVLRDGIRSQLLNAIEYLPASVRLPVPVGHRLTLRVQPRAAELRYAIPDKEGGVAPAFERCLSPGDTVIDAGAHIGYYACLASQIVGKEGTVVAFEPHPEHAQRVRGHSRSNGCTARVEQVAVTDTDGVASLRLSNRSGGHAIDDSGQTVDVGTRSLDSYLDESGLSPDLVKLDVEGAELAALNGMRETLQSDHPTVIIELHPGRMETDVGAVFDILVDAGYDVYKLPDEGELTRNSFVEKAREGVVTNQGLETHLHIIARY